MTRLLVGMDIKSKFGTAIRSMRLEQNLSQEELAARVNANQGYISLVEAGQMNVTLETAQQLAQALGADISIEFKDAD